MNKNIPFASIFSFCVLIGIGGVFSYLHAGRPYTEYRQLWEYRRLHPQFTLSAPALKVVSVWHSTSYADMLWIRLMQYIGDNIWDGKYLNFTHKILTQIQYLHPRFAQAYELDILFLPSIGANDEDEKTQQKRKILEDALKEYDTILPTICDMKKVETIDSLWFGLELSERKDLHNPCISWLIPYYIASRYDSDLQNRKKAAFYYKIASMHDDVPEATKFLGIIAFASTWNYRDGALTFSLLAHWAYDEYPFMCQSLALRLTNDLSERIPWTEEWIRTLENEQKNLQKPANNNPVNLAGWNCYDLLERWIKQVYVWYITDITRNYPDIQNEVDIVDAGLLDSIPTISSQSWFTILKKGEIWRYRHRD